MAAFVPISIPCLSEHVGMLTKNQLDVMCTTHGERSLVSIRCQKECLESKLDGQTLSHSDNSLYLIYTVNFARFYFRETSRMRSFAKTKPAWNGENTLSFTDVGRSCQSREILMCQISLLMLSAKIKFSRKFPNLQYAGRAKFRHQVFKILLLLIISFCIFSIYIYILWFLADFYVLNSPSSLVTVLHTSGWIIWK